MLNALKELISSKKALMAIASAIVAGVAKLGLELDTEAVLTIITPLVSFVIGQGVADLGKEKAKVEKSE
jgi:hypothetical protein